MADQSGWNQVTTAFWSGLSKRIDSELTGGAPPQVNYANQTTRTEGGQLLADGVHTQSGQASGGLPINKTALMLGLGVLTAFIVLKVGK